MLTDKLSLWGHGRPDSSLEGHRSSFTLTIILLRCLAVASATALVCGSWLVLSSLPSYIDAGLAVAVALAWAYKFERES